MYSKTPKALFLCGSNHHLILFNSILKELDGWNSVFYINQSYINASKSKDMKKILCDLKLKHEFIPKEDMKSIMQYVSSIFEKENPDIVITPHDQTPMARLFIKISNSMSIPTLMVQDGLFDFNYKREILLKNRTHNRMKFFLNLPLQLLRFLKSKKSLKYKINTIWFELKHGKKGTKTIYGTGESTKIAVFGDSTKEFLVSMGVNSNKIVITGSPKFDPLFFKNQEVKNQETNKRNNNPKKVLVLTQPMVEAGFWTGKQRESFIRSIIDSTSNIDNIELIFKLHPLEHKVDYEKIVKFHRNVEVIKNSPLDDIIQSSDLCITIFSTAGLEAMILKKPLIIINLFNDICLQIFKEMNVVHVTDKRDIEKTIMTYLYQSKRIKNLLDSYENLYVHTYTIDGKSSIRIASLIKEMLNDKKTKEN